MGDDDPEATIHKYFEKFYENKYFECEVNTDHNHTKTNIWSVKFDDVADVVCIFKATIIDVSGN